MLLFASPLSLKEEGTLAGWRGSKTHGVETPARVLIEAIAGVVTYPAADRGTVAVNATMAATIIRTILRVVQFDGLPPLIKRRLIVGPVCFFPMVLPPRPPKESITADDRGSSTGFYFWLRAIRGITRRDYG